MKKQLIVYLLGLMLFGNLTAQTCLPGTTIFSTQGQIDSFNINYPGCTEVLGSIIIREAIAGTILNVDGFSSINAIGGDLNIGGDFSTNEGNALLNDLSGFQNLTTVGGGFNITSNASLTSLSAISNLNFIEDNIIINQNPLLTNLVGLNNITSIDGGISINDNDALESISALGNITSNEGVGIKNNASLLNLDGLEGISFASGNIEVKDNESLQNLQGLINLTAIGGELTIRNNHMLPNLSGLESLISVGEGFYLTNTFLQNLIGLESLTTIGGMFYIGDNDSLINLVGVESLSTIDDNLFLVDNFDLQNLSGLEGLTSIGGNLMLYSNTGLLSLEGLNNLTTIDGEFDLHLTFFLEDILDLESLTSVGGMRLENNFNLSLCNLPFLCDYIMTGGVPFLEDNSPGCNTSAEILATCFANVDHTNLVGQVIADFNLDCQESSGDTILSNWLVNASNEDYSITLNTDSLGNYWIPVIEGDWEIKVIPPSSFWSSCFGDSLIYANASGDTISTDFIETPEGDCAYIDWDLILPILRVCNEATYVIDYCNYGTQPTTNFSFSATLDELLTIQSASVPYTIETDGTILFEIEALDVFECEQITFQAMTDCDSLMLNDVLCVNVGLLPDDLCSPDTTWDESTIVATGTCQNDSIFFELENIGSGNMSQPAPFRVDIVIDDIVLLLDVDNYQLIAGDTLLLSYALEGNGMRLETNQNPGHPVEDEIFVVVPNCEDIENNIILNLLPSNNGDPFMETFCGTVVGSYDPNIKTARPVGIGADHEIDKNWTLDYTIQFQNTGNDTAFLVVIKDTLSENLDISTLRVGGGSDSFTWALNPGRELVFTFENILLPDSTTNEPASHGLVAFSIDPRADLLPGDIIENRVGIYFDFNDPVITNTVFHTILKPVVTSSEHLDWCFGEMYNGLEIWQDTSIQILTEFVEYDSIHFVHLDVLAHTLDSLMVDVEIGTYFENVLIEGDTVFIVNYTGQNNCDSLVTYTITGLTDVNDLTSEFKAVKIFPNPIDDFLYVFDHQSKESQEWRLVNNLGVVVWQEGLQSNEALPKISTTSLPSGVYWLTVKTATTTAVWKVIRR